LNTYVRAVLDQQMGEIRAELAEQHYTDDDERIWSHAVALLDTEAVAGQNPVPPYSKDHCVFLAWLAAVACNELAYSRSVDSPSGTT
jgi:hypothetical protein